MPNENKNIASMVGSINEYMVCQKDLPTAHHLNNNLATTTQQLVPDSRRGASRRSLGLDALQPILEAEGSSNRGRIFGSSIRQLIAFSPKQVWCCFYVGWARSQPSNHTNCWRFAFGPVYKPSSHMNVDNYCKVC